VAAKWRNTATLQLKVQNLKIIFFPLKVYIMATYYAAQFGITLSASEIFVETRKQKQLKKPKSKRA
jgi:hypothetical protein